jgi:hypothetical protein
MRENNYRRGGDHARQEAPLKEKTTYEEVGRLIGALVDEKNKAYGSSFHKAGEILRILYPNGVPVSKYQDMLFLVRVLDKMFRIATSKDAFGENPAKDIAGYAILMSEVSKAAAAEPETEELFPGNISLCK